MDLEIRERSVEYHLLPSGPPAPFGLWRDGLKDPLVRAAVLARIARMRGGNFGDSRPIGEGASENRIHLGPGYRIYYGINGDKIVLLCSEINRRKTWILQRLDRFGPITRNGQRKMPRNVNYKSDLLDDLRNDDCSSEAYLAAAMADSREAFLVALRDVAEARLGGIANLAEEANVNRETLYRTLSVAGNPRFSTLESVLSALGMNLTVKMKSTASGRTVRTRKRR